MATVHLNRNTTYAELAEQARRTASMLHRLGVRPGDRVGVLLPNVPEFLSTVNGIWMAGAAVVAISPLSCGEEVPNLLKPPVAGSPSPWMCWLRSFGRDRLSP